MLGGHHLAGAWHGARRRELHIKLECFGDIDGIRAIVRSFSRARSEDARRVFLLEAA